MLCLEEQSTVTANRNPEVPPHTAHSSSPSILHVGSTSDRRQECRQDRRQERRRQPSQTTAQTPASPASGVTSCVATLSPLRRDGHQSSPFLLGAWSSHT
ncbi:hypothetical protein L1887_14646 [Cichorium endivia]|nr:hypothetical protein L1887_14646 [Cichorium endivia]